MEGLLRQQRGGRILGARHQIDGDGGTDGREKLVKGAHALAQRLLVECRDRLDGVEFIVGCVRVGPLALGRRVPRDHDAHDVGLEAVVVVAAEVARQVLGEQLQRQHVLVGLADAQARDERDVALRGRVRLARERRLAGQARAADALHLQHALIVERASDSHDGPRNEHVVCECGRELQRDATRLVLDDEAVALAAVLAGFDRLPAALLQLHQHVLGHLVHDIGLGLHLLVQCADDEDRHVDLGVERLDAALEHVLTPPSDARCLDARTELAQARVVEGCKLRTRYARW